ncbi:MAG TPA: DCC1-like thiol-disulfide oxidoreductase family protein [Cyclobacteriaceae bacterium]|jgi:predicted DCC family thiol-disulfide oxidoreductase YuxK|nr:DCC1-like thiol-disulfide oxidoreductase family protein [Cyclobacteriaceae bacterium]
MGAINSVEKIILFDGVCNLCSASVQFIIKRDRKKIFLFASLQSDFAKKALLGKEIGSSVKTIVFLKGNKIYLRSNAVLEISRELKGLWPLLYFFKIIPRFIRDAVYNFISQHRYQWFGKNDECWLPSPDLSSRFVD